MHPPPEVTVVMYHYVRELANSAFPRIKGLSLEDFEGQLDYIGRHYTPVRVEDVAAAMAAPNTRFPENAVLLTFDDGYSDHYANVFPALQRRKMQGCFFPSAQPLVESSVLEVNKIHFILASTADIRALLEEVLDELDGFRPRFQLKSREDYLRAAPNEHRFDEHEVVVLKRLLQRDLPEIIRFEIVGRLFRKYVTEDEAGFSQELYMSEAQIVEMRRSGMHIGCHGYTHAWLNHLTPDEQENEIGKSLAFLKRLGISESDWTICYPYGGFNESLLKILRRRKCKLGFSVENRIARLGADDRLTLPRIDTNDLPKASS